MNRIICANGHFYDADKYASCPHCAEGMAPAPKGYFDVREDMLEKKDKSEKREKKGLFGMMSKREAHIKETDKKNNLQRANSFEKTMRIFENDNAGEIDDTRIQEYDDADKTLGLNEFEDSNRSLGMSPYDDPDKTQALRPDEFKTPMTTFASVSRPKTTSETTSSLQSELIRATDARKQLADEEKTMSFFSSVSSTVAMTTSETDEGKTKSLFSGVTEPPVGYLVCIKGEDFGRGYLLKSGNNTIGRSQSMDVVILDPKVSRDRQAFVMYEPRKREFYLKPGEGSSLTYYEDELVLAPVKINAYGKISFGETDLLLILVCCEKFSWDTLCCLENEDRSL